MTDSAADIHYTLILIFALNVRSYVEAYRVSKAVNRSRFVSVSQRTSRDPGHEWFSFAFRRPGFIRGAVDGCRQSDAGGGGRRASPEDRIQLRPWAGI